MSKELIQFQNIIQLEILHRPSKKIKSPYVADAINKNGDEFLVHTPGLGLADQCLPGSKIFATPSKNKNSKTDYIAQSVSVIERDYGKTLIGANPHTAELIGKKILKSNFCHKDLIDLMQSPKKKYDFNLDEINKNHGKEFNSRFITSEIYGTRSTTVITISRDDQVKVTEVVYDKAANELETNSFKFKILN